MKIQIEIPKDFPESQEMVEELFGIQLDETKFVNLIRYWMKFRDWAETARHVELVRKLAEKSKISGLKLRDLNEALYHLDIIREEVQQIRKIYQEQQK